MSSPMLLMTMVLSVLSRRAGLLVQHSLSKEGEQRSNDEALLTAERLRYFTAQPEIAHNKM